MNVRSKYYSSNRQSIFMHLIDSFLMNANMTWIKHNYKCRWNKYENNISFICKKIPIWLEPLIFGKRFIIHYRKDTKDRPKFTGTNSKLIIWPTYILYVYSPRKGPVECKDTQVGVSYQSIINVGVLELLFSIIILTKTELKSLNKVSILNWIHTYKR